MYNIMHLQIFALENEQMLGLRGTIIYYSEEIVF